MKKKGNLIGLVISLVIAIVFQIGAAVDTIASEGVWFYIGVTLLTVAPVAMYAYLTIKEW